MKRWIGYIVVLGTMLAIPVTGIDVGCLQPVEVIELVAGETVTLLTDTGNTGTGMDFASAYQDMKRHAAGEVFLDTADYLILVGDTTGMKETLLKYLNPQIGVCEGEGDLQIKKVGAYLSIHRPNVTLKELNTGKRLPVLSQEKDGFWIK